MEIDLNCDLGEDGAFDAELMPLITSANIACGFHAGGPSVALAALRAAARHGVHAGAHPGFADREHFGRRELDLTAEQIYNDCVYQIGALTGLGRAAGVTLHHVKPHGALYNQACRDDAYARPVIAAVELFSLALVALPGSRLEALSRGRCRFVAEGFADRRYLPDGSLTPRSQPDAFVADPAEAVRQAEWLLRRKVCAPSAFTATIQRRWLSLVNCVQPLNDSVLSSKRFDRAMSTPLETDAVLEVLHPGLCTLIVDQGRPHSRNLGVPVGGAADRSALAIGNALVGNEPDAAALEIALVGPTLVADAELACVLYGAHSIWSAIASAQRRQNLHPSALAKCFASAARPAVPAPTSASVAACERRLFLPADHPWNRCGLAQAVVSIREYTCPFCPNRSGTAHAGGLESP